MTRIPRRTGQWSSSPGMIPGGRSRRLAAQFQGIPSWVSLVLPIPQKAVREVLGAWYFTRHGRRVVLEAWYYTRAV